jgi:hypothetical protein
VSQGERKVELEKLLQIPSNFRGKKIKLNNKKEKKFKQKKDLRIFCQRYMLDAELLHTFCSESFVIMGWVFRV